MDPCCALKYYPEIEACQKEVKSDLMAKKLEEDRKRYETFGGNPWGRIRRTVWNLTEYPESSVAAQVFLGPLFTVLCTCMINLILLVICFVLTPNADNGSENIIFSPITLKFKGTVT